MYNLYKRRGKIKDFEEKLKIKPLTKEQMILCFDRLTRFKYPEDKYMRVFSEILLKNLIYPSFNKKQLGSMSVNEIISYVSRVWNFSLKNNFTFKINDFLINNHILELENKYFYLNKTSLILLNSKLNFAPIITELNNNYEKLPLNLKRMCDLYNGEEKHFPLQKIILVEGITEDILLPEFAKLKGCDFDKLGYYIVVSGGKNQIVKQYTKWHKILKIPVFILLDADGKDVFPLIEKQLEKKDEIYMLKCGEFEDAIEKKLILKTLKSTYPNIIEHISKHDFDEQLSAVKNLENYFKLNGLGEFKKADFAASVKENITKTTQLSEELETIINKIIK